MITDTTEKGLKALIAEAMTGVSEGKLANVTGLADRPASYDGTGWS